MNLDVQQYADEFLTLLYKVDWNPASDIAIYQFKSGLPKWMVNQLSTAESQHLLSAEILGHSVPPMNVEMLAKLASRIEANSRIHDQQDSREKVKNKIRESRTGFSRDKQANTPLKCSYCKFLGHSFRTETISR